MELVALEGLEGRRMRNPEVVRDILGLDIGTAADGSGIVHIRTSATDRDPVSAENTKLMWAKMVQNAVLLNEFRRVEVAGAPDKIIVFEGISSYGKKVGGDTFGTLAWIWRMFEAFDSRRAPGSLGPVIILRRVVSAHLVGSCPKGKMDAMIKRAVAERFAGMGAEPRTAVGLKKSPGPLYGVAKDMWSALAVAVTFAEGAKTEVVI